MIYLIVGRIPLLQWLWLNAFPFPMDLHEACGKSLQVVVNFARLLKAMYSIYRISINTHLRKQKLLFGGWNAVRSLQPTDEALLAWSLPCDRYEWMNEIWLMCISFVLLVHLYVNRYLLISMSFQVSKADRRSEKVTFQKYPYDAAMSKRQVSPLLFLTGIHILLMFQSHAIIKESFHGKSINGEHPTLSNFNEIWYA